MSSLLLFDTVSTTFIPGKISSEKGVEVKSIAELRAFYGICPCTVYTYCVFIFIPTPVYFQHIILESLRFYLHVMLSCDRY
jgi:hypothetical protein